MLHSDVGYVENDYYIFIIYSDGDWTFERSVLIKWTAFYVIKMNMIYEYWQNKYNSDNNAFDKIIDDFEEDAQSFYKNLLKEKGGK